MIVELKLTCGVLRDVLSCCPFRFTLKGLGQTFLCREAGHDREPESV